MKDLKGKVALITGAARGMGRLHALSFAREGATVAIADIDGPELRKTATEIRDAGYAAYHYTLDVSDRAACLALAAEVESDVGPVDVLVNNAAVAVNEAVLDTPEDHFRRIMDVNYLGQVWMMQAIVPGMVRRRSGHVVNICSLAGKAAVPKMGAYCAAKFALIGITDAIRLELRGTGVEFTIVNPGYVATGMFEGAKPPIVARWQDPQKVVDMTLDAVKKDRAEIFVPYSVGRSLAFLRGLGYPRMVDFCFRVLGVDKTFDAMRKERGRPF